jgi:hypothetical protein
MSTVCMDILLIFFLIWDYNFSSLALCWYNKYPRRTITIKFVQTLFSFSYGSIKFRRMKIFNGFSTFFLVFAVHFAYPYISDWERKKESIRTSKKLFNILFLFNRNSDSKEKKLVGGFNLFFIADQIVGCSFDKRMPYLLQTMHHADS